MNAMDEELMVKSTVLLKNDNDLLPLGEGINVYVDSNNTEVKKRMCRPLASTPRLWKRWTRRMWSCPCDRA